MTTYKSDPSSKHLRAIKVLEDLLQEEGLDSVQRAYAQAVVNTIISNYATRDELKLSAIHGDVTSLSTGHSVITGKTVKLRCEDHSSLWLKGGKPYRYVTQPYKLNLNGMRELVDHCDVHGLSVRVNAFQSWHFPGNSLMVELKKRGE